MEANLSGKLMDRRFMADLQPLLAPGIEWNLEDAMQWALREVTPRLDGDPWKGESPTDNA